MWNKSILSVGLVFTTFLFINPAHADHDRERCYDYECESYDHDYSSSDRNRNRNRDRGAFSPGPFQDSPVDAFNNICLPGATCYYEEPDQERESDQQPPDQR